MLMPIFTPFKKPVVTGSFASSGVSTADLAAYTFSGVALGTAATNRHIVIAATTAGGSAADASSVTVGGVSASLVVRASGSDHTRAELWIASVPSGTTGDVVITWSGTKDRCGYAAWAMYGASASASDTATDSDTTPSFTIDVPANGYLIAGAGFNGPSSVPTATWTGVTEDYDETTKPNSGQTGGSVALATAASGRTVSFSPSSGLSLCAMAAASFTPA
tara:strand:+ start:358 stop:1017 length:660 start_codon:yes stop_codon:yes gene_type:complete